MKYLHVCRYIIEAETAGPLHIGSSDGDPGEVLLSPEGMPMMQASSLCGAVGAWIAAQYGAQAREDLLGSQRKEASVIFSDAAFDEETVHFEVRPRLRIDPVSGTSASAGGSGQKFETGYLSSGSRFTFGVTAFDLEPEQIAVLEDAMAALQSGEICLGGMKTNGCGQIRLLSVKKRLYDMKNCTDRTDWLNRIEPTSVINLEEKKHHQLTFVLTGKTEQNLLVKSGAVPLGENVPDAVQMQDGRKRYIIPGSSLKGSVRAQCTRIAHTIFDESKADSLLTTMFGSAEGEEHHPGKVTFSEAVLENPRAQTDHRIRIDAFTGGVAYHALFSEQPVYSELTVTISIKENMVFCGLLMLALRDLMTGVYGLGSGRSIGRGFLKDCSLHVHRGDETLVHLECEDQQMQVLAGQKWLESALHALKEWTEAEV